MCVPLNFLFQLDSDEQAIEPAGEREGGWSGEEGRSKEAGREVFICMLRLYADGTFDVGVSICFIF